MKKIIFVLLLNLVIQITASAQINYGIEAALGGSKMHLNDRFENIGEYYSGGLFINYTDKKDIIYQTGVYYDVRKLKFDRYIIDGYVDEDKTTPIYSFQDIINYRGINDLKIPLTIGIRIKDGIFSKINLTLQGGMFFSYGLFGNADIMYDEGDFGTLGTKTSNIYNRESLKSLAHSDENPPNYEYYPLQRFDTGTVLKIGLNYKHFSLNINSENGFINLKNHYYDYMKSSKLYLSVAYDLK